MANFAISRDIAAFIQKGFIHKPGFYGNQELKGSHTNFNSAMNISAQLYGSAKNLKSRQAPVNYNRATSAQYYLSDAEKILISKKATELSSYGFVSYDALEDFLYILAVNESEDDLFFIADVVGIPQLASAGYIRNITGICGITDLYKVGYLANGVSAINRKYAGQYMSAMSYDDYERNSAGDVLKSANFGQAFGVIGSSIVGSAYSFNNYSGPFVNAPSLSDTAINTAIYAFSDLASGNLLPPQAYSAVTNQAVSMEMEAAFVGADVINSLIDSTPLGGALSSLGSLGSIAAAMLVSKVGGNSIGGFMSEIVLGQRLSTSKRANNPMLVAPSYAGKAFFGEAPVSLPATDQIFCRRVGAFGHVNGGAGVMSFGMQNFNSFGGALSIASVVSRLTTGSFDVPSTDTYYGQSVGTTIGNVCNILNVPTTSSIELRRSDNAIPFMLGMSAAIVEESFSPFGSTPFSEGWKVAASAGNDMQKYNPAYMRVCQTVL